MNKMEIKVDSKWLQIQDSLYWEDLLRVLKEAKKRRINLDQLIKELNEYIEENPDSPYVRGE